MPATLRERVEHRRASEAPKAPARNLRERVAALRNLRERVAALRNPAAAVTTRRTATAPAKKASSDDTCYDTGEKVMIEGLGEVPLMACLVRDTPAYIYGSFSLDMSAFMDKTAGYDAWIQVETKGTAKSMTVSKRHWPDGCGEMDWSDIADYLGMEQMLKRVPKTIPLETVAAWAKNQGRDLINAVKKPLGLEASRSKVIATTAKQAAAKISARTRVAAAWTLAKVLAPSVGPLLQYRLASTLLENSTSVLTAALRNAAKAAHFSHVAETLEIEHKVNLNDLLESPKVLETLKNELAKELKAEPVKASKAATALKKADEEEKKDKEKPAEEEAAAAEEEAAESDGAEETPAEEAVTVEEQVQELETRVDAVENDVAELEQQVETEGEEEIDLEGMFGGEEGDMMMDEKMSALANEGEEVTATEGEEDFFGPSNLRAGLEGMDEVDITDASDFFQVSASEESDPLGQLMGSRARSAKALRATPNAVVEPGDLNDHFKTELAGDDRDAESDHEDDLLYEVAGGIDAPEFEQEHNVEPEFELPKSAVAIKDNRNAAAKSKAAAGAIKTVQRGGMAKKSTVVKTVGDPAARPKGSVEERRRLASLVFKDEDEY
jgi:hypothetical protein